MTKSQIYVVYTLLDVWELLLHCCSYRGIAMGDIKDNIEYRIVWYHGWVYRI